MNLGIVVALGYGILVLIGGIIGYFQAKSKVSLLSGGVSGLLIIFAALGQLQGLTWGLTLAALITGILVVFFAFRLVKTRKFMPSGLMIILGTLALAVMVNQIFVSK
ncbi:MAG TPA: TMEM14 family protein [Nostocaceae cyanobacterium]|nr:TMEM14 family protein [Nostocaceae cyanobacterium]